VSVLSCPVCDLPLERVEARCICAHGHSFDVAREGYVNLLLSTQKASREPGDSREMVRSRRAFLEAGHYTPIAERIAQLVQRSLPEGRPATILDAGCGEGYFLRCLGTAPAARWGIDISRWAVRSAATADPGASFAVASIHRLPVRPGAVDVLLSVLAPRDFEQFHRALAPGAHLVVGVPGPRHLYTLRGLVYRSPREHETESKLEAGPGFELVAEETVTSRLRLDHPALGALVAMTPYLWHLDEESRRTLAGTSELSTDAELVVRVLRRV
jgi:23S rRNA (guanine745-N1)-methyltransferase